MWRVTCGVRRGACGEDYDCVCACVCVKGPTMPCAAASSRYLRAEVTFLGTLGQDPATRISPTLHCATGWPCTMPYHAIPCRVVQGQQQAAAHTGMSQVKGHLMSYHATSSHIMPHKTSCSHMKAEYSRRSPGCTGCLVSSLLTSSADCRKREKARSRSCSTPAPVS